MDTNNNLNILCDSPKIPKSYHKSANEAQTNISEYIGI